MTLKPHTLILPLLAAFLVPGATANLTTAVDAVDLGTPSTGIISLELDSNGVWTLTAPQAADCGLPSQETAAADRIGIGLDLDCSLAGGGEFETARTCLKVSAETETTGDAEAQSDMTCESIGAHCRSDTYYAGDYDYCGDEDTGNSGTPIRCKLHVKVYQSGGSAYASCSYTYRDSAGL